MSASDVCYKAIVAYDGTRYQGWQAQGHTHETVVGALTASFSKTFYRECTILGASRTDAGVHAVGQVIRLRTDCFIEPTRLLKALNSHLPVDIRLRSCIIAPEGFHPLQGVVNKRYYYHLSPRPTLPFISRYVYSPYSGYDFMRLSEALRVFVGEHDFRSFCTGNDQESTIRVVRSIRCERNARWGIDRVVVDGPSFLRHMIRRMVGAALCIAGSSSRSYDELRELLAAKNPETTLATAPAHGLLLRRVWYD
jgi:tRNA pseudouridine38-40 synthase